MNIINSCPNCDSFSIDLHEGQLSRFVYDRMLDLSKTTDIAISFKIFRCSNCNFIGTTVRFSEQEEKQYYRNYMKEEYINQYNLSSLQVLLNKYGIEVIVGENFRYPRYINSAYYVLGKLK